MQFRQRFYSVSEYYKEFFGQKIYKIALDAGCTCPNRDGSKGWGGCIFCSPSGSGDFAASRNLSVLEQIEQAKAMVQKKKPFAGMKYIAYFQNFSNTYGNSIEIEKKYLEALSAKDVVGLSIATRPDCLNDDILNRISQIAKKLQKEKKHISIELGLQTARKDIADYLNLGFYPSDYVNAVKKIKESSEYIHIVTHIIFGLPNESAEDMLNTVRFAVKAGTHGIKISLLHILSGTKLEKEFLQNKFSCLSLDDYLSLLGNAISILPKNIVVHRLTGDGAKSILIAPLWTANKKLVHNAIHKYLEDKNIYQGDLYLS